MRLIRASILAVLAVCLCVEARGQPWSVARALSITPASADLFVAVSDASGWKRSAGGEAFVEAVRLLAARSELESAWSALGEALGLDPERAFDLLLGRGLSIAQREAAGGAPASWVLVCHVDQATEKLIRGRLKPAPRGVQRGFTVMALEDGRFWLAAAGGRHGATLLLAPASASSLFDESLALFARPDGGGLAAEPVAQEILGVIDESSALLIRRLPSGEDESAWLACSASRDGPRAVRLTMVARSPMIAEAGEAVAPWSRTGFDALADGAYLAMAEHAAPGMLPAVGLGAAADLIAPFTAGFDGRRWLGERYAVALRPSPEALAEIVVGFEARDRARLAESGDRAMALLLSGIWAVPGPAAPPPADPGAFDFGGQFPEALRVVDAAQPVRGLLPALFDHGPSLAWVYAPAAAPAPAESGWWVIGTAREEVLHAAAGLTRAQGRPEEGERWISLGEARPAAFFAEVRRRGIAVPPPLAGVAPLMERVERAAWRVWRSPDGSVRGEGDLRFALLPDR